MKTKPNERNWRIVQAYLQQDFSMAELGRKYGVSRQRIFQIVSNDTKYYYKERVRQKKLPFLKITFQNPYVDSMNNYDKKLFLKKMKEREKKW